MDFIGPLPVDNNCNCILSIIDRLGADICIIPTQIDITAEDLAVVFFNNWYCENGLPNEIICDCNKLFILRFWKTLTKLTGVKLKMSTAYHPETDGSNERSNKTINQMLGYHVKRNQKGWVRALPRIHFQITNSINASTGYSGFQLHLGRSPRVIPPLIKPTTPTEHADINITTSKMITCLLSDVADACDNLLIAKITQSHHTAQHRGPDPDFKIGDLVMLSTANWRYEYKKKGEKRTAKFFPHWDGPYKITNKHPEASTYTLNTNSKIFPVFHASELKRCPPNDNSLFPS
jgi:hypothetical protein